MIFTLPRVQESIENRSEIGHANKIPNKSNISGTWLEKSSKREGGNGAVRAPEILIFLTSRLSGSIFGPRPPLDDQSNENGAQMIPKFIKIVTKCYKSNTKLKIWKQTEAYIYNKTKPYIMEAIWQV